MTERLLQYIWQFQYFNKKELRTTAGEDLMIIHPGQFNNHQGPDFQEGRIRIGYNLWAGNIELHIHASDWHRHLHDSDPNYENVILHVVWNDDDETAFHKFPTLQLADRVPKLLLQQYDSWMKSDYFIPCAPYVEVAEEIIWIVWKERLLIERLQRKSDQVLTLLERNNFHWEEMLWWMIARNFGLYVNADAFEEMAISIPYNLLSKHRNQIHQLEAMIFGQAGLLEGDFEEKYPLMLKKEYVFLQTKYDLVKTHCPVHFLRMRPACFPTIRLAQLAMLIHTTTNLFSSIINAENASELKVILNVTANDYWHYHFTFDESTVYHPKTMGAQMINNIIVNSVIPILFTYGEYRKEERYKQKAIEWISRMPSENNSVTTKFRKLGIGHKNASDSQALIELKSQYCDFRRCLDCAIGNALLSANLKVRSEK